MHDVHPLVAGELLGEVVGAGPAGLGDGHRRAGREQGVGEGAVARADLQHPAAAGALDGVAYQPGQPTLDLAPQAVVAQVRRALRVVVALGVGVILRPQDLVVVDEGIAHQHRPFARCSRAQVMNSSMSVPLSSGTASSTSSSDQSHHLISSSAAICSSLNR